MIYSEFSFDSRSAVPDFYFWAGTPTFQESFTKLHGGTPYFSQKVSLGLQFENPSEKPDILEEFYGSFPGVSRMIREVSHV